MRRALPVLLAAALALGSALCHRELRGLRQADLLRERQALAGVLSPGEILGASLLGGFRALAVNIVWVRLFNSLDEQRYQGLPLLHTALEVLQGASPSLYLLLAEQMVFDIPSHLPHRPEERWGWIRRGVETLEEGQRRFPASRSLLLEAGRLYYLRFQPERFPQDRARFRAETGRDPLELARDRAARTLLDPDHPFDADVLLWAIERRLGDREAARRLLEHAREAHGPDPAAPRGLLEEWQEQVREGGR